MESLTKREKPDRSKINVRQPAAQYAREARHQAALLPEGPIEALLGKAKGYETEVPEDKSYK